MNDIPLVCAAALLAGFTQGLTGFGSVIVALPAFTILVGIKTAAPLANLLALGISLYLCIRLRKIVQWSRVWPLLAATIPGIPLGIWMLKAISPRALEIYLALTLMVFSLYAIFGKERRGALGTAWAWFAGFTSGLLGGSIGAFGPPIVIYCSFQPWSFEAAKAAMSFFFLLAGGCIVGFQAVEGFINTDLLTLTLLSLPAVAFGAVMGTACQSRINDRVCRQVILGILLLFSLYLLVKPTI
ncbi:MAG: sulfite exporter TauE/SafE family protein [Desulfobacteraceae bacterium]|nr:sulfite exporter TauE/SafE family protein [Desulfobacteraceae bacterium]